MDPEFKHTTNPILHNINDSLRNEDLNNIHNLKEIHNRIETYGTKPSEPTHGDYVVHKGDTTWKLSQASGLSVEEFRELNNLKKGEQPGIGTLVQVPLASGLSTVLTGDVFTYPREKTPLPSGTGFTTGLEGYDEETVKRIQSGEIIINNHRISSLSKEERNIELSNALRVVGDQGRLIPIPKYTPEILEIKKKYHEADKHAMDLLKTATEMGNRLKELSDIDDPAVRKDREKWIRKEYAAFSNAYKDASDIAYTLRTELQDGIQNQYSGLLANSLDAAWDVNELPYMKASQIRMLNMGMEQNEYDLALLRQAENPIQANNPYKEYIDLLWGKELSSNYDPDVHIAVIPRSDRWYDNTTISITRNLESVDDTEKLRVSDTPWNVGEHPWIDHQVDPDDPHRIFYAELEDTDFKKEHRHDLGTAGIQGWIPDDDISHRGDIGLDTRRKDTVLGRDEKLVSVDKKYGGKDLLLGATPLFFALSEKALDPIETLAHELVHLLQEEVVEGDLEKIKRRTKDIRSNEYHDQTTERGAFLREAIDRYIMSLEDKTAPINWEDFKEWNETTNIYIEGPERFEAIQGTIKELDKIFEDPTWGEQNKNHIIHRKAHHSNHTSDLMNA